MVYLLLVPGLLLVGVFLGLFFFALSVFPPAVSWIAAGIMGVVLLWFFFGRSRGASVLNSESAVMGRQTSKDGLL